MADWKLNLYHRLPAPLRTLAASARGRQLRNWRYGPETDRLVEEALARDSWSLEQWRTYREERLAYVLQRAAIQVPFYREQWAERRRKGDQASWELLENWPLLDKEMLRRNCRALVAEDRDVRRMFHEHTSGTSGKPLDLWYLRATVRQWYALFEARWRRWHGVSRATRWAIIGGQLVTPVARRRPPFWVWNSALNQLYCSSYHLAPDLIPHYLDALAAYRVEYLLGYSSSLYALAQTALALGRTLPMKVAITNAEPIYDYQRAAIAAAFQCPVRETYGMAEFVTAAGECEAGGLHLWPEIGLVEILTDGQAVPPGATGELVCTSLFNADMPLIRYRVGDRAACLPPHAPSCGCGRTLPRFTHIEGRVDDVLYTADGRLIGRLDPVFKTELPIHEAQIVQERLDLVRVRYVPAPGFDREAARSITSRLQARMGAVEVQLEEVTEIPRGASGKFRAVICALPQEQLAVLRGQPQLSQSNGTNS
jgi:phenylacetate-CoA ligase